MALNIAGTTSTGPSPTTSLLKAAAGRALSGTTDSNSAASAKRLQEMADKGGKVADIVDRYNLRNISYTDLQAMTKELMGAGALKETEMLDFLPPSMEYASIDGSRNADWNAPKDYIGLIEQQIYAQEHGFATDERTLKHLKYQLELIQRFEQPVLAKSGYSSSIATRD